MTLLERWHTLAHDAGVQDWARTLRTGRSGEQTLWDPWQMRELGDRPEIAGTVTRTAHFLGTMDPDQMGRLMADRQLRWATAAEWCLRDQLDISAYLVSPDLTEQRLRWLLALSKSIENECKVSM